MKIYEAQNVLISYYDQTQHIICVKVTGQWTWEDAHHAISQVNEVIKTNPDRDFYTIYQFMERVSIVPKGSAFANLRSLAVVDLDNEQLLLFVGISALLKKFLDIVGRVYGLRQVLEKYRFVNTMDEALAMIRAHQSEHSPQTIS